MAAEGQGVPDPEELDLHIVIIASQQAQAQRAAQFLTRRGWPTQVVTEVQKAIKAIVTMKPDYVFVSVDHPNGKIAKLPPLLAQSFNTTCVAFGEKPGATTRIKIKQSKAQYKMDESMSGPSMFRRIKKIYLEQQGVEEPLDSEAADSEDNLEGFSRESNSNGKSMQSSMINVKGGQQNTTANKGSDQDSGLAYMPDGSSGSAQNRAGRSSSGSDDGDWAGGDYAGSSEGRRHSTAGSGPAYMPSEDLDSEAAGARRRNTVGEFEVSQAKPDLFPEGDDSDFEANGSESSFERRRKQRQAANKGPAAAGENLDDELADALREIQEQLGDGSEAAAGDEDDEFDAFNRDPKDDLDAGQAEAGLEASASAAARAGRGQDQEMSGAAGSDTGDSASARAGAHSADGGAGPTDDEDDKGRFRWEKEQRQNSAGARARAESKMQAQAKARGSGNELGLQRAPLKPGELAGKERGEQLNLIYQAIENAAETTCKSVYSDIKRLVSVETCEVFRVQFSDHAGYVLIFSAATIPVVFYKELYSCLQEELQRIDPEVQVEEFFQIDIPSIPFDEFREELSPYSFRKEHLKFEIGFLYSDLKVSLPTGLANEDSMTVVPPALLNSSTKLRFNLYLRLEKNNKYLLYVHKGNRVMDRQLEKMRAEDPNRVRIQDNDRVALKHYMIEASIDEKIREIINRITRRKNKAS